MAQQSISFKVRYRSSTLCFDSSFLFAWDMNLITTPYLEQSGSWPQHGRHILAQFDDSSIVVYQAYNPSIGHFAARHGYFGGEFKLSRMSWIKPNFLWMMHRSGWGTKPGQEVTLAVRMRREAFDSLLAQAVHSSYVAELYSEHRSWRQRLSDSAVRLQWDPDHDPAGAKLERRAIQLGLSGGGLQKYARQWIVNIEDISDYVAAQRDCAGSGKYEKLVTPKEEVYPVAVEEVARRLQISQGEA